MILILPIFYPQYHTDSLRGGPPGQFTQVCVVLTMLQEFLTFGDFIDIILQFRGSNSCTVKDMVEVRRPPL